MVTSSSQSLQTITIFGDSIVAGAYIDEDSYFPSAPSPQNFIAASNSPSWEIASFELEKSSMRLYSEGGGLMTASYVEYRKIGPLIPKLGEPPFYKIVVVSEEEFLPGEIFSVMHFTTPNQERVRDFFEERAVELLPPSFGMEGDNSYCIIKDPIDIYRVVSAFVERRFFPNEVSFDATMDLLESIKDSFLGGDLEQPFVAIPSNA